MGATRKITYGSLTSKGEIFSAAENWGALRTEKVEIDQLAAQMSCMCSTSDGNRFKLTAADQKLPEGEFSLYFLIQKNDSGCKQQNS